MLVTFNGFSRMPLVQTWNRMTITASAATARALAAHKGFRAD